MVTESMRNGMLEKNEEGDAKANVEAQHVTERRTRQLAAGGISSTGPSDEWAEMGNRRSSEENHGA
jgi:hypothetical protein